MAGQSLDRVPEKRLAGLGLFVEAGEAEGGQGLVGLQLVGGRERCERPGGSDGGKRRRIEDLERGRDGILEGFFPEGDGLPGGVEELAKLNEAGFEDLAAAFALHFEVAIDDVEPHLVDAGGGHVAFDGGERIAAEVGKGETRFQHLRKAAEFFAD